MATAVMVWFRTEEKVSLEQATEQAREAAAEEKQTSGLIQKFYIRSEDGNTFGGIYLWKDRAAAEAFFDEAWFTESIKEHGLPPDMNWFDAPVLIDNRAGEVVEL